MHEDTLNKRKVLTIDNCQKTFYIFVLTVQITKKWN